MVGDTMGSEMVIRLAGNLKVEAIIGDHTIRTDQPVKNGGDGTAPTPIELFLSSIGTCAGVYAATFCKERNIPCDGIGIRMNWKRDKVKKVPTDFEFTVTLPGSFPKKYDKALKRAIEQCTVKRTIHSTPSFQVRTIRK